MRIPDRYDTIFMLKFDDPDLAQLEVRVRRSFGLMDAAADLAYVDLEAVRAGRTRPEDLVRQRALVDAFAGAIVSWNLEDADGQPVPTDREAIRGQDIVFISRIVAALIGWANQEATAFLEAAQVDESQLSQLAQLSQPRMEAS